MAVLLLPAAAVAQQGAGARALTGYAGQYRESAEPDQVYSIALDGGTLRLYAERLAPVVLAPAPGDVLATADGLRLQMRRNAAGKVTGWHRTEPERASGDAVKIADAPEVLHAPAYTRDEAMIPMRDGVKLHAVIVRPAEKKGPLPILLNRTPYGVAEITPAMVTARWPELARDGYIFVFEDDRGRYGSEGVFTMMKPLTHTMGERSGSSDESTDAHDTVAWMLTNIADNNGRVGVTGISYDGFLAAMAGIDAHPAVKAVSPQAPMTDVWMGDDFFHNGAFRQTYGYDYVLGMESGKTNAFGKLKTDAYDYFLKAGNFANAAKLGGIAQLPTAAAFVEHPAYDDYWQARAVTPHLKDVTVPELLVGGYWDQEDMFGPQAEYAALARHDRDAHLLLGPWDHGQWAGRTTRHLGALDFGEPTTEIFRKVEREFFERHLRTEAARQLLLAGSNNAQSEIKSSGWHTPVAPVMSFQTGSNTWKSYMQWPPATAKTRNLYLEQSDTASFTAPLVLSAEAKATYLSDPKHPVPYRHRPIQATYAPGSQWYTWLAEDQRFVTGRKDVAHWETPALETPLTVTGEVKADIFAATSGSDADWVVKLIDVYPADAPGGMGGYQLMVAEEIFRGRYRESFTQAAAIPKDAVEEYAWSLHGVDHVFLPGHRLMVTVQSSWFPLYDRNPQTFVPNIMTAPAAAYRAAAETIYESGQHASHLVLPVMPENR